MKEIKAVIDTNVFVRMLIGKSATLLKLYQAFIEGDFTPIISPPIKEEILEITARPRIKKYFTPLEIKRFKELLETDTIMTIPAKKVSLCRDHEDNMIIEAAIEAKVKYIVSLDKDLLEIPSAKLAPLGVKVITPEEFLKAISGNK